MLCINCFSLLTLPLSFGVCINNSNCNTAYRTTLTQHDQQIHSTITWIAGITAVTLTYVYKPVYSNSSSRVPYSLQQISVSHLLLVGFRNNNLTTCRLWLLRVSYRLCHVPTSISAIQWCRKVGEQLVEIVLLLPITSTGRKSVSLRDRPCIVSYGWQGFQLLWLARHSVYHSDFAVAAITLSLFWDKRCFC
jgi:hypothetical protein